MFQYGTGRYLVAGALERNAAKLPFGPKLVFRDGTHAGMRPLKGLSQNGYG